MNRSIYISVLGQTGHLWLATGERTNGKLAGKFLGSDFVFSRVNMGASITLQFALDLSPVDLMKLEKAVGPIGPGAWLSIAAEDPEGFSFSGPGAEASADAGLPRMSPPSLPDAWVSALTATPVQTAQSRQPDKGAESAVLRPPIPAKPVVTSPVVTTTRSAPFNLALAASGALSRASNLTHQAANDLVRQAKTDNRLHVALLAAAPAGRRNGTYVAALGAVTRAQKARRS